MKGFLLIELLIASALSLILILALTTCLTFFIKNYYQQEAMNNFYDQANIMSKLLQKSLSNAGDLGCQIFQDPMQIENKTSNPLLTNAGVIIYQIDRDPLPTFLSSAIKKKLLPHSVILIIEGIDAPLFNARYDQQKKQFQILDSTLQKQDLVLLSNCRNTWLFNLTHFYAQKFTTPFEIINPDMPYYLAKWQTTIWFAMKNNQKNYGLYRLKLPSEKTPVEIISDVKNFQASAVIDGSTILADASLNWKKIVLLRLMIGFEKDNLTLQWPLSIVLTRKAQSWRTL
jgi:hypothetical protein